MVYEKTIERKEGIDIELSNSKSTSYLRMESRIGNEVVSRGVRSLGGSKGSKPVLRRTSI